MPNQRTLRISPSGRTIRFVKSRSYDGLPTFSELLARRTADVPCGDHNGAHVMFFTALKDGKDWGAGASGSPVVSGTKDWIVSQVPMKRFGQPEDIAAAVLYLTSSESAYVIGADLIIDGGMKTLR